MSRPYRSQEQWLDLIAEFESSNQRQTDFCKERSINPKYFSARKNQLSQKKPSDFVQVKPLAASSRGHIGNGAAVTLHALNVELTFPLCVEPRWLALLVKELSV